MANYSDMGAQLSYTGATSGAQAVPTAYPSVTTIINAGAASNLVFWVKFTTGAASNFTGFSVKLQGSYNGAAGSWVDLETTAANTGATASEQVVTGLVAATTYWRAFQTSSNRLCPGGLQLLFKANGGAVSADDVLIVYVTAW